jgi:hypothetical protein
VLLRREGGELNTLLPPLLGMSWISQCGNLRLRGCSHESKHGYKGSRVEITEEPLHDQER